MAEQKIHNLDNEVRETFKFTIKGHTYEFRQMTTEEIDNFQNIKTDKEIREYLYSFITKIDPEGPEFTEIAKQMIAPHWRNFMNMVIAEMGGKDGSS